MKKLFLNKVLPLVAVALIGVALTTSCKKDKEEITDTQNPPDITQTDTTAVEVLDPYMDSIYRSIPDPDTSVRSSMNGFKIWGRWCWKSRLDTVCSMILDFDRNGKIYPQYFKSDHDFTNLIAAFFSNCIFAGDDSCTYVLRNDTLMLPLHYYRDNNNNVLVDTFIDPTTLIIPPYTGGAHKITLFNNQNVMRLDWFGYDGLNIGCEQDFYLTRISY